MKINHKNLGCMGFKPSDLFQSKTSLCLHHKIVGNSVWVADGISHVPVLGIYRLSAQEMKKFKKGKLALVPPGYVSPGHLCEKKFDGLEILHEGKVNSKKHLLKIFIGAGLFHDT